ncbi:MAG: hypothetical protein HY722_11740 [Planctomycetes bacterium]|nr:hypothetical protein [Planctomycetota bacterium]
MTRIHPFAATLRPAEGAAPVRDAAGAVYVYDREVALPDPPAGTPGAVHLLRALVARLEGPALRRGRPVTVLYEGSSPEDPPGVAEGLTACLRRPPDARAGGPDGVGHRVWRLDRETSDAVARALSGRPVHALGSEPPSGMVALVEAQDPALVPLGPVLSMQGLAGAREVLSRLAAGGFRVTAYPVPRASHAERQFLELVEDLRFEGLERPAVGLVLRGEAAYHLAVQEDPTPLAAHLVAVAEVERALAPVFLERGVVEGLLAPARVVERRWGASSARVLADGGAEAVLLGSPVRARQVVEASRAGRPLREGLAAFGPEALEGLIADEGGPAP